MQTAARKILWKLKQQAKRRQYQLEHPFVPPDHLTIEIDSNSVEDDCVYLGSQSLPIVGEENRKSTSEIDEGPNRVNNKRRKKGGAEERKDKEAGNQDVVLDVVREGEMEVEEYGQNQQNGQDEENEESQQENQTVKQEKGRTKVQLQRGPRIIPQVSTFKQFDWQTITQKLKADLQKHILKRSQIQEDTKKFIQKLSRPHSYCNKIQYNNNYLFLSQNQRNHKSPIIEIEIQSDSDCMIIEKPKFQKPIESPIEIESEPDVPEPVFISPVSLSNLFSLLNNHSSTFKSNLLSSKQKAKIFKPRQRTLPVLPELSTSTTSRLLSNRLTINQNFEYEFGQQTPELLFRVQNLYAEKYIDSQACSLEEDKIEDLFNEIRLEKARINEFGFKKEVDVEQFGILHDGDLQLENGAVCLSQNNQFRNRKNNIQYFVKQCQESRIERYKNDEIVKQKQRKQREKLGRGKDLFNMGDDDEILEDVIEIRDQQDFFENSKEQKSASSSSFTDFDFLQQHNDLNIFNRFCPLYPQSFQPSHVFKTKFSNSYKVSKVIYPTNSHLHSIQTILLEKCSEKGSKLSDILEQVNQKLKQKGRKICSKEGFEYFKNLEDQGQCVIKIREEEGKREIYVRRVINIQMDQQYPPDRIHLPKMFPRNIIFQ